MRTFLGQPVLPSRPGEFHPEPLTDPDLILSHHPARATARRLAPFPLPSPARFSRSIRQPDRASRCLHAGCRSVGIRTSSELIPEDGSPPGFDIAQSAFDASEAVCLRSPLSTLPAGIMSRRFRDAHHHGFWPQQLAVAWDQRPDRRTRRAILHLSYSYAPPFGPAILVTQDLNQTWGSGGSPNGDLWNCDPPSLLRLDIRCV